MKRLQSLCLATSALFYIGSGCQSAQNTEATRATEPPLYLRPMLALIRYHKEVGTHMDGPRCPMYPSCAAYADKALRTHGFLGFLLLLDRLVYRESGTLYEKYLRVPYHVSHETRYYDPVSDFPCGQKPSMLTDDFGPE